MAKTIFNMVDGILTPCNVACGCGIMTVNSPSGSRLQRVTWLWDDMSLRYDSVYLTCSKKLTDSQLSLPH